MKDGHVHSPYCLHGSKDSFQMYIEKAIASGIDEISFTEHFPLPKKFLDPSPKNDSAIDLESFDKYINELKIIKTFYAGVIKINIGAEIDYIEGYEEEIKDLLNKYGKFLEDSILSVHMVKYEDKYYCIDYSRENFAELVELLGSVEKVYDLYYNTLKKAINSDLGEYKPKRIGHINLVRKYNKIFPYDYSNNENLEEIVKLIKNKNYEVDYNISGLYKEDCKEKYIDGYLYDLINNYDIPMVFGSDSHSCETLGEYNLLKV